MIWIQGTVYFVQWSINYNLTKFFDVDRTHCDKMSMSNHGLVGPSNPATTPHPSTPSKSCRGSNASQRPPTPHRNQSPSFRMPSSMPSWGISRSNALLPTPATPRKRKDNVLLHLHGIKTRMPGNLSLDSSCTCLMAELLLSYTPDDWQVHLIWHIFPRLWQYLLHRHWLWKKPGIWGIGHFGRCWKAGHCHQPIEGIRARSNALPVCVIVVYFYWRYRTNYRPTISNAFSTCLRLLKHLGLVWRRQWHPSQFELFDLKVFPHHFRC